MLCSVCRKKTDHTGLEKKKYASKFYSTLWKTSLSSQPDVGGDDSGSCDGTWATLMFFIWNFLAFFALACAWASLLHLWLPLYPVSAEEFTVCLEIKHKLYWGWEQWSWSQVQIYLTGSKKPSDTNLYCIKSVPNKREQIQQFLSLRNPLSFCWTRRFHMDLHPVSCSTFVHSSRSLFVLGNLLDNTDKSHFLEMCKRRNRVLKIMQSLWFQFRVKM